MIWKFDDLNFGAAFDKIPPLKLIVVFSLTYL
jgi:hypothetical protein